MSTTRYRNAVLFLLVAVLFGSAFVGIEAGLAAIPPIFFAALRFDVATPLLLVYAAWRYDEWIPRSRVDFASVGTSAVTIIVANNALLFLGQQTTTPAVASVMYGLNPILSPVFGLILLDERLDLLGTIGIVLGLIGVIVIVRPSPATFTSGSTLGPFYLFGAASTLALGSVLLKRFDAPLDSIPLTAWAMALGAVILHGFSLGLDESTSEIVLTPTIVLAVLVVGIPSTAVAYPAYFALVPRIGPVRTNLVAYVVPVVASITGWILLNEPITPTTAAGFCIIVAGIVLLERRILVAELERAVRVYGDTFSTADGD